MDKAPIAGGKGGVVVESPAAYGFQGFHIKKKSFQRTFLSKKDIPGYLAVSAVTVIVYKNILAVHV